MNVKIKESSFTGLGKVTGGTRWTARIIRAGKGSSGVYTESALRDTGPAAFPAGTKVNIDHQGWESLMEQPAGTLHTLAGALVSDPVYVFDEALGRGVLEADIEFSQKWAPFAEQFKEIVGLSISAAGWGEEYDEDGAPIIEGFIPSPLNTVDLVTVPGAGGRLLELKEAYRDIIKNDVETTGKDEGVKPEDIQALTEAIKVAVTEAFAGIKESLVPKLEDPEDEQVKPSDIAEAIVTAELPKSARAKVYEAVSHGVSIEAAIEQEKNYIKELSESLKVEEARTGDVKLGGSDVDYQIGTWK